MGDLRGVDDAWGAVGFRGEGGITKCGVKRGFVNIHLTGGFGRTFILGPVYAIYS